MNIQDDIRDLVAKHIDDPDSFEAKLIGEMIYTSLSMYRDQHDTAQLKLINRSLKEMRYAYKVFNQYPTKQRLSIFGSARTPENHPDYIETKKFSAEMARHGWMCITGAAGGIMKAGHEGSVQDKIFGLSIMLTFEPETNAHIEGDPKHINFKYFFTRKLMFLSHSDAVIGCPGGFGTMDELFEVLTLMQTGKSSIIPVILLEHEGGRYWKDWEIYVRENFLKGKTISPEDMSFFYIAKNYLDACDHIFLFYKRYHSSRYVKNLFVIRMKSPLNHTQIEELNRDFGKIVKEGRIEERGPLPEESEYEDLPRLVFHYTRTHYGILRELIDRINSY